MGNAPENAGAAGAVAAAGGAVAKKGSRPKELRPGMPHRWKTARNRATSARRNRKSPRMTTSTCRGTPSIRPARNVLPLANRGAKAVVKARGAPVPARARVRDGAAEGVDGAAEDVARAAVAEALPQRRGASRLSCRWLKKGRPGPLRAAPDCSTDSKARTAEQTGTASYCVPAEKLPFGGGVFKPLHDQSSPLKLPAT